MTRKTIISPWQAASMLVLFRVFSLLTIAPGATAQNTTDVLLALPLSYLVLSAVFLPLLFVLRRSGVDIIDGIGGFGVPLAKLAAVILCVFCLLAAAFTAGSFAKLFTLAAFKKTSPLFFTFTIAAVCGYAAFLGLEPIARMGSAIFAAFLAFTLFVSFAILPKAQFFYIKAPFLDGVMPFLRLVLSFCVVNFDVILWLLLAKNVKGSVTKSFIIWAVAGSLLLSYLVVLLAVGLGDYAGTQEFPFYSLAAFAEISVFQRSDSLHLVLWSFMAFLKIGVYLYFAAYCLGKVFLRVGKTTRALSCTIALQLLAGVAALLLCTGCMKPVAINNRAIVEGIGVDTVNDEYLLSLQIYNPQGEAAQAAQANEKNAVLLTARGGSIAQALAAAELIHGREIFYGQTKVIILGETAADKLLELMNFFGEGLKARPNVDLVLASGSAEELLSAKTNDGRMTAVVIKNMLDNAEGKVLRGRLMQAQAARQNGCTGFAVPFLSKNGDADFAKSHGSAVFSNNMLCGVLTTDESWGALLLKNEMKNAQIVLDIQDGGDITAEVLSAKTKYNVELKRGVPHFKADIKLKSRLQRGNDRAQMRSLLEASVKERCEGALRVCLKTYKADIFSFANLLGQRKPDWYTANKESYRLFLPQFTFEVNVSAQIVR
ncbi:MAG: Ger(x)C family spore germination protein [Hydrogenoanaerobacterium sp.]